MEDISQEEYSWISNSSQGRRQAMASTRAPERLAATATAVAAHHHSIFEGDDAEQPATQRTGCYSVTRPSLKLKISLNISKASENPAVKSGKLK